MKRNLFSLYAVFCLAVGLQAQNQMHVNMKDGSVIDIIVSEIESVTWDATNNEGGDDAPDDSEIPVAEAIDLGLSVMWASFNVGASSPEEYGDYFAWGETEPKQSYNWTTYKWSNGSYKTLNKYCLSSSDGSVDNRFSLELEDDAAHVSWGGSWRMPTAEEQKELCNNCKWTWGSMNGVAGYIVVSEINGNSIFLPAAGQRGTSTPNYGKNGYYWSGSLYTINSNDANFIIFSSKIVDRGGDYRNLGKSIRPVCPRH